MTTDLIPSLRSQIDDLDARIIELVSRRAELSRQVQEQRIAGGGLRLELDRERAILRTYATALGEPGTSLADAVLRTCRGAL
ncbi:MAG TPA: chorismate mutase [Mycobacteriales bacterium]|jgi:chorismate mutase|nr:chorismate mutase [Mycobacteriales bacterium]